MVGDEETKICCKYDWISDNIAQKIKLRKEEKRILKGIIDKKFAGHASEYWSNNNKINRDLNSRTIGEWIENEICFLSGFALWFREKEDEDEIDISNLISNAINQDVKAGAQIAFDRKRIELLSDLPSNALLLLKEMSPAGKIAYRSLDMAIIKGLSEGDKEYAMAMKKRTQKNIVPWWKFW